MALRGTLTHRKTRRLASTLDIDPCFALGVIEGLWHVTAEQAPAGDIGRMSDADIGMELFYSGDAGALIQALAAAGFLDEHPQHRLVVHDWHIHSDDATDNKLSRAGLRYANGALPRMRRLSKEERARAMGRYPESCESVRTAGHDGAQIGTKSHYQSQSPEPVPEPEPEMIGASPSAPPKAKRISRGSRLPEDFAVTDEHRRFAMENSLPDPDLEIGLFRDHWQAEAGGKAVKANWDAAFRSWLRRAVNFHHRSTQRPNRAEANVQSVIQGITASLARIDQRHAQVDGLADTIHDRWGPECDYRAKEMIRAAIADGTLPERLRDDTLAELERRDGINARIESRTLQAMQ